MDLKYCKRCKKLYSYGNMGICSQCLKEIDALVVTIRDYLDKNPGATISVLSDETGIDERDILYLIRQERVELMHADGSIKCESCGASIKSGRYCDTCKANIKRSMSSASDSIRQNISSNNTGRRIDDDNKSMDILEFRRKGK